MRVPVAIEPTKLGTFRAECASPFTVVAEGSTREEAVLKVRDELNKQLEQGKEVVIVEIGPGVENPLLAMAGWLKDDPMYDDWQASIQEYRQELDRQEGIVTNDRS